MLSVISIFIFATIFPFVKSRKVMEVTEVKFNLAFVLTPTISSSLTAQNEFVQLMQCRLKLPLFPLACIYQLEGTKIINFAILSEKDMA
jgi:hypothetical protein